MTEWEKEIYNDITHEYMTLTRPQAMTILNIIKDEIMRAIEEVEIFECANEECLYHRKRILSRRGIK